MKGFVYLLEIAVAAILMVVVLSTFFAIRVKQSWESSDLITAGNNILNYVGQEDEHFLDILDEDFVDMVDNVKLPNIGYGLNVRGSPKSNIVIGCAQAPFCDYIQSLLTPAYLNGRWINFYVEEFDITIDIPNYFDAIVFVDYTDYTAKKTNITDYLNEGGVVIGINATYDNNYQEFEDIFGLTNIASSSNPYNFITYDPATEDIEKYFMGIGFDLNTNWYIWEDIWTVVYGSNHINISKGADERNLLNEGDSFDLTGPDSNVYSFKVKKILPSDSKAIVQTTSTGFAFKDFSEATEVTGNQNVVSLLGGQAAVMTTNESAIWMSDFPFSSEYSTLLKAAIISRNDDWVAKGVFTERETSTVSSFFSLCCDMPETAELEITLWNIV